jgi:hypothetical protein
MQKRMLPADVRMTQKEHPEPAVGCQGSLDRRDFVGNRLPRGGAGGQARLPLISEQNPNAGIRELEWASQPFPPGEGDVFEERRVLVIAGQTDDNQRTICSRGRSAVRGERRGSGQSDREDDHADPPQSQEAFGCLNRRIPPSTAPMNRHAIVLCGTRGFNEVTLCVHGTVRPLGAEIGVPGIPFLLDQRSFLSLIYRVPRRLANGRGPGSAELITDD